MVDYRIEKMNFSEPEVEYYKKLYKLGLFETADLKFSHTTLYANFDNNGRFVSIGYTITYAIIPQNQ